MLTYFPTPYPDELLYSLIARYHALSGNYYVRQTIFQLFGRKDLSSSTLIPKNLGYMSEQIERFDLDFNSLLFSHTLFPLYALFAKQQNIDTVYKNLKNNELGAFANFLGVYGDHGRNLHLRFCPLCRQEEFKLYGDCYWHRLHQAPGVLLCEKHLSPLSESNISTIAQRKKEYIPATSNNSITQINAISVYSPELIAKAEKMVMDVQYCINNFSTIRRLFLENNGTWTSVFLSLLYEHGLATEGGSIHTTALIETALSSWGKEWLDLLDLSLDNDRRPWVISICRRSKVPWHPIKYILMAELLCGSMKELVSRVENKTLMDKKVMKDTIKIIDDNKTDFYRKRWLTARANAQQDIKKYIQAMDPATYLWLQRNDRKWLTEHSPESQRRYGSKKCADWDSRDNEYANKISEAAIALYNIQGKPVQVTERKIIYSLHLPPSDKLHERCPRTCLEIKKYTETAFNWRIRKIRWAVLELETRDEHLAAWAILKKAGIRDSDWNYFQDIVQQELDANFRKKA